eukprot:TRINITY_DN4505_c0_g1_i1.p1 TRINITY_DN4505_c0_g1~~TRINITY_DN4505_c0_g1_i1.p1  ORF type:complete len:1116 (-),score=331.21 TRINITY_DN4505_c0_g1_i1:69-3347(-)
MGKKKKKGRQHGGGYSLPAREHDYNPYAILEQAESGGVARDKGGKKDAQGVSLAERECYFKALAAIARENCGEEAPEEEAVEESASTTSDAALASGGASPLPSSSHTLQSIPGARRGLRNLGNTCFFNSVMQNLVQLAPLRSYFLPNSSDDVPPHEGRVTFALRLTVALMTVRGKHGKPISPGVLFKSLASYAPQYRGYQQQDAHELLRLLLDIVHTEEVIRQTTPPEEEDTAATSGEGGGDGAAQEAVTVIDQCFRGELLSSVTCTECGSVFETKEPFLDLTLQIPETEEQKAAKRAEEQRKKVHAAQKSAAPPRAAKKKVAAKGGGQGNAARAVAAGVHSVDARLDAERRKLAALERQVPATMPGGRKARKKWRQQQQQLVQQRKRVRAVEKRLQERQENLEALTKGKAGGQEQGAGKEKERGQQDNDKEGEQREVSDESSAQEDAEQAGGEEAAASDGHEEEEKGGTNGAVGPIGVDAENAPEEDGERETEDVGKRAGEVTADDEQGVPVGDEHADDVPNSGGGEESSAEKAAEEDKNGGVAGEDDCAASEGQGDEGEKSMVVDDEKSVADVVEGTEDGGEGHGGGEADIGGTTSCAEEEGGNEEGGERDFPPDAEGEKDLPHGADQTNADAGSDGIERTSEGASGDIGAPPVDEICSATGQEISSTESSNSEAGAPPVDEICSATGQEISSTDSSNSEAATSSASNGTESASEGGEAASPTSPTVPGAVVDASPKRRKRVEASDVDRRRAVRKYTEKFCSRSQVTVYQALFAFTEPDELDGENMYRCSKCTPGVRPSGQAAGEQRDSDHVDGDEAESEGAQDGGYKKDAESVCCNTVESVTTASGGDGAKDDGSSTTVDAGEDEGGDMEGDVDNDSNDGNAEDEEDGEDGEDDEDDDEDGDEDDEQDGEEEDQEDNDDEAEEENTGPGILVRAFRQYLINALPPVLTIVLKRFASSNVFDAYMLTGRKRKKMRGGSGLAKVGTWVDFPLVLDVAPFVSAQCAQGITSTLYTLSGIVIHEGSMQGGHYTACVRTASGKDAAGDEVGATSSWFSWSDTHGSEVSAQAVVGKQAYILFYHWQGQKRQQVRS